MEKKHQLIAEEKKLMQDIVKRNLDSLGIKYGDITEESVEIFDQQGNSIVGNVNMPEIDLRVFYNEEDFCRAMVVFLTNVLKAQGLKLLGNDMFFEDIDISDSYFCGYKAEKHRHLTHFVSGENFFCEEGCLEKVDTRGFYDNNVLEFFWEDFNSDLSLVAELSELKNVSVAHYKGKFWEIHPTFHQGETYVYVSAFSKREELLEAFSKNNNNIMPSFIVHYEYAYYRATAVDSVIKEECKKAKALIEKEAYSIAHNSAISVVVKNLFLELPFQELLNTEEELEILSNSLKKEKEFGSLFTYASNLSNALLGKIFENNLESLRLESIGTIEFIQKAREILSIFGNRYELVLDRKATHYNDELCFGGTWKLVRANEEEYIDWRSLVFNTESAINNAIYELESLIRSRALAS